MQVTVERRTSIRWTWTLGERGLEPLFMIIAYSTCIREYRKQVYTYPVGDLATSLGVRWQPDPGGFSFCLGVPIQVAGQRIQNKIRHPIL